MKVLEAARELAVLFLIGSLSDLEVVGDEVNGLVQPTSMQHGVPRM